MNITSMNGAELFRTLTGKDPAKPTLDMVKEGQTAGLSESTGAQGKRDVFVRSSPEIEPETDSFSRLMDYDNDLDFRIRAGMTKEQLATHFGDMAKRLDEAYSQGKFTQDEYNELNAGLLEGFDSAITRCERRAASMEVIKENMRARQSGMEAGQPRRRNKTNIEKILEGMGVYGKDASELTEEEAKTLSDLLKAMEKAEEEREEKTGDEKETDSEEAFKARIREKAEELDRQVDDFVSRYCRTDRTAMRAMLETVRRGGELDGGRDRTYGGRRSETWFTDGYVSKPYF